MLPSAVYTVHGRIRQHDTHHGSRVESYCAPCHRNVACDGEMGFCSALAWVRAVCG